MRRLILTLFALGTITVTPTYAVACGGDGGEHAGCPMHQEEGVPEDGHKCEHNDGTRPMHENDRDGEAVKPEDKKTPAQPENQGAATKIAAHILTKRIVIIDDLTSLDRIPPTGGVEAYNQETGRWVHPRFADLTVLVDGLPVELILYFIDMPNGINTYLAEVDLEPESTEDIPENLRTYYKNVVEPELLKDGGIEAVIKKLRQQKPGELES